MENLGQIWFSGGKKITLKNVILKPQLNLIVTLHHQSWFDRKMTLDTHYYTNSMSALSQPLLTRFDQTLRVGSWDHLAQIQ